MTEFELELLNTLKEHERTTKENLELIEKLQYDLEKAKYEKIYGGSSSASMLTLLTIPSISILTQVD